MLDPLAKRNIEIMIDMCNNKKEADRLKMKEKLERYVNMLTEEQPLKDEYISHANSYMMKKWKGKS